jgi:HPt (histidine-containing phosphotransfer) domain-containing protein
MMGEHLDRESAVWNPEQLVDRCLGNLDFLERVLDTFCTDFTRQLCELDHWVQQFDSPRVASIAHKMKGAAANIAAERLADCSATIEQLARQQRSDEIPVRLRGLKEEWERFTSSIQTWQQPACRVARRPSCPAN